MPHPTAVGMSLFLCGARSARGYLSERVVRPCPLGGEAAFRRALGTYVGVFGAFGKPGNISW